MTLVTDAAAPLWRSIAARYRVLRREGRAEFRPGLQPLCKRVEGGIAVRGDELGIGHPHIPDHAGGCDPRLVEPRARGPGLGSERLDRTRRLRAATLDPFGETVGCRPDYPFVGRRSGLVDGAGRQRDQTKRAPSL